MIPRHFHLISTIDHKDQGAEYDDQVLSVERALPVPEQDANTISSVMIDQPDAVLYAIRDDNWNDVIEDEVMHAPVIDIDFPAVLIPSSTPGHFHLYLERPVKWSAYVRMLEAMSDAGLVERGYVRASVARGRTFVRKPTCTKPSTTIKKEEAF